MIETYANAFGDDAAAAFSKAIRAWHAGIEVTTGEQQILSAQLASAQLNEQPPKPKRVSARLPVPMPLHHAVNAGRFGQDDRGRAIRPSADEVRAITENHAEKMIEGPEEEIPEGIRRYAEDFGPRPAAQLDAYVRRQRRSR